MKLEKQVCSLENSKKLHELGVKQNSHFGWCVRSEPAHPPYLVDIAYTPGYRYEYTPAYTVAELGEMLRLLNTDITVNQWDHGNGHVNIEGIAAQYNHDSSTIIESQCFGTEADARALMLIWLIENRHVDVGELNGNN